MHYARCDLAAEPKDRFYAELDLADGLQKLAAELRLPPADRCQDQRGRRRHLCGLPPRRRRRADGLRTGCRNRRVARLDASGQRGARLPDAGSSLRRQLIDQRARGDALNLGAVFHPRSIRDVLVSREFEAGASTLTDMPALADLADSVVAEADAQSGQRTPAASILLGLAKDIRGAGPDAAAQYFAAAADCWAPSAAASSTRAGAAR